MSNAKKKRVSLRGSKGTIQRVLKLIQPYRGLVLFTLLLAAVTVLTTLYAPILSGRGVDLIVARAMSTSLPWARLPSSLALPCVSPPSASG